MKVIWLGSIILPQIAEAEHCSPPVHNGWLIQSADLISAQDEVDLLYLFPFCHECSGQIGNMRYFGLSEKLRRQHEEGYIRNIVALLQREAPDVVHIWGAEFEHSYPFMEAAIQAGKRSKVVVSIQGLRSVYAKDYAAFLPPSVVNGYTLNNLVKGNIRSHKKAFEKKGQRETALLRQAEHLIGRTDWDKAAAMAINPHARYYHNNETLRQPFYSGAWQYESCEKHSIFCSQSHYPIKGVHLVLQALVLLKKVYPDTMLYVGGENIMEMPFWRINSYRRYLRKLIHDNDLQDNVRYTGFLTAEQMKERYLRSNVFVSASSIENSSNSIGEAMLLGTPVVSSCVGGILSLLKHEEEGLLYPANEVNMLAYRVLEVFADPEYAMTLSMGARKRACKTHDGEKNAAVLMQIYRCMIPN